jgi:hypothetical protein
MLNKSRIKWKRNKNNGANCKKNCKFTCQGSKVNCVQMEGESNQQRWTNTYIKVRSLMYEHLMVQRRPNPRGRFYYWQCPKRSGSPSIGAFDTPKIVKNKTIMKKLWPPRVGRFKKEKWFYKKHMDVGNQWTKH